MIYITYVKKKKIKIIRQKNDKTLKKQQKNKKYIEVQ